MVTKKDFKLPIVSSGLTLLEIPDCISIYFEIGNCTSQCRGCHSPELSDPRQVTWLGIDEIIERIHELDPEGTDIDCIVFMGGLTNRCDEAFKAILKGLYEKFPMYDYGLYHGSDTAPLEILQYLSYLKLGRYDDMLGGLDKETTNQRLIEVNDITYKFRRKFYNGKKTT